MSYTLVCFWKSGSVDSGFEPKVKRMGVDLNKVALLFLRKGEKVVEKNLDSIFGNHAN